ncbi:MAG: hypothetical protein RBS80_24745, partial [Thermoguttaceae bacterium]|nr:hypothetical protein [Thermoguttaceae bacterium]
TTGDYQVRHSPLLGRLVPKGGKYGYDLIAHVGVQTFLEGRALQDYLNDRRAGVDRWLTRQAKNEARPRRVEPSKGAAGLFSFVAGFDASGIVSGKPARDSR